ncbi:hypothetical protein K450DRAFT_237250 [Umbelopsis ramanniana AG]|uniref:Uncharacterized protein n=1 Tax=Umbelopsis ramanniana AG TaxID=1314678 RepID=A0AAD5ECI9_UMBRA|nr:uncharacterized protein K450DRAFT_237250 [Umbelopsis ramanniana AG]KAI8580481.1 hypothetical protein K450DRAFT_237250 [Umbelopsis ramanniana AG]
MLDVAKETLKFIVHKLFLPPFLNRTRRPFNLFLWLYFFFPFFIIHIPHCTQIPLKLPPFFYKKIFCFTPYVLFSFQSYFRSLHQHIVREL